MLTIHRYQWRNLGSAMLWRHLLAILDPKRIVIVAAPHDLACLTNTAIHNHALNVSLLSEVPITLLLTRARPQDWAFGDMNFHILELGKETTSQVGQSRTPPSGSLDSIPTRAAGSRRGFAASSIVKLREWTHLAINEGSFLKAYGTYEFFERGPPSIVDSIIYSFLSRNSAIDQIPAVRHLQYTGIFPFVNHVSELFPILDHVEEFDIRLAPDVDSGILDDRERVGYDTDG
jgi:hypothetical protein